MKIVFGLNTLELIAAFRAVAKRRASSALIIGTLTIGIGLASAATALVGRSTFFRDKYPNEQRLRLVATRQAGGQPAPFCFAAWLPGIQGASRIFEDLGVSQLSTVNAVVDGVVMPTKVASLSSEVFRLLGVHALRGRLFTGDEYSTSSLLPIVVSSDFCRRNFGSSDSALSRTIVVAGQSCTVIGVLSEDLRMPEGFTASVYRPIDLRPNTPQAPFSTVSALVSLHEGVPEGLAVSELRSVRQMTPSEFQRVLGSFEPMLLTPDGFKNPAVYWTILLSAISLYALACVNAANLFLVRVALRKRDRFISVAIGGSPWRVFIQTLFEAMILCSSGGAFGILVAVYVAPTALAHLPSAPDGFIFLAPTSTTLLVGLLLSAASAVCLAAIASRELFSEDLNTGLKDSSTLSLSKAGSRTRGTLLIFQIASTVVLVAGTILLASTYSKLTSIDLGFNLRDLLKVQISGPNSSIPPEARESFFRSLGSKISALGGVRSVSFGSDEILANGYFGTYHVQAADGRTIAVSPGALSASFARTVGIGMIKGRWISDESGKAEAVLSETLAKVLYGSVDPVGKLLKPLEESRIYEIVGVARNLKETVRGEAGFHFYTQTKYHSEMISTIVVGSSRSAAAGFASSIRQIVYDANPQLTVDCYPVESLIGRSIWAERYALNILRVLSVSSLLLAFVGAFSVNLYSVRSHMKEFGVRLALGARASQIFVLIVRRAVLTASIGSLLGLGVSLGMNRVLSSLLYETSVDDWYVLSISCILLILTALLACILPAFIAAKADCVRLLKAE